MTEKRAERESKKLRLKEKENRESSEFLGQLKAAV